MTHNWHIEFTTYTRDDIINVCRIIHDAIPEDFLNQERELVFFISGLKNCGKAVIADSLTNAIIDGTTINDVPQANHMQFETAPSEAANKRIYSTKAVAGQLTDVYFLRDEGQLYRQFENPQRNHLIFLSTGGMKHTNINADISLYMNSQIDDPQHWTRQWRITIQNSKLLSPLMEEKLTEILNFYPQRQKQPRASHLIF